MKVKLHQPMKGKKVGDTVDLDKQEADRMIAFGYAARTGGESQEPKIATSDDTPKKKLSKSKE